MKQVILHKTNSSDFEKIISWVKSEKELFQFAGSIFTFPLTHRQLELYLNDPYRKSFILSNQDQIILGHAELYDIGNRQVKISRVIIGEESLRNQGWGKLIINTLTDFAQRNMNANYVELNVYEWNKNAIACYMSAGFKVFESKTKTIQFNGENWIAINMYKEF